MPDFFSDDLRSERLVVKGTGFPIIKNGVNYHRPKFNRMSKNPPKPSKNLATNKKPLTKNLVSG